MKWRDLFHSIGPYASRGQTGHKVKQTPTMSEGIPTAAVPNVELFGAPMETSPLTSLKQPAESKTRTSGVYFPGKL